MRTAWPKETTMEKLEMNGYATMGAVLKYDDNVLVVGLDSAGFHAAVYEFVDTPEETGLGDIECRLWLADAAIESFKDGGRAMAWCMTHI